MTCQANHAFARCVNPSSTQEYQSFSLNCGEKAETNTIALGVKYTFASRWTHKQVIYASFPTFYTSEKRETHVDELLIRQSFMTEDGTVTVFLFNVPMTILAVHIKRKDF